jgi:hypothetical protein
VCLAGLTRAARRVGRVLAGIVSVAHREWVDALREVDVLGAREDPVSAVVGRSDDIGSVVQSCQAPWRSSSAPGGLHAVDE